MPYSLHEISGLGGRLAERQAFADNDLMQRSGEGKILALDPGEKRIGVAVSDEMRLLAQPLCVIHRKNRDADVAEICRLAAAQGAVMIVVGLPLTTGGEAGEGAQKAASLAKRLARRSGLPVELVDEWQTTVEAEEVLVEAGLSRRRRRQVVDKTAAALILKRYLDGL